MHMQVEAAEELFEVLTHPSISKRRVPIVLACNKMDQETQVSFGSCLGCRARYAWHWRALLA